MLHAPALAIEAEADPLAPLEAAARRALGAMGSGQPGTLPVTSQGHGTRMALRGRRRFVGDGEVRVERASGLHGRVAPGSFQALQADLAAEREVRARGDRCLGFARETIRDLQAKAEQARRSREAALALAGAEQAALAGVRASLASREFDLCHALRQQAAAASALDSERSARIAAEAAMEAAKAALHAPLATALAAAAAATRAVAAAHRAAARAPGFRGRNGACR